MLLGADFDFLDVVQHAASGMTDTCTVEIQNDLTEDLEFIFAEPFHISLW